MKLKRCEFCKHYNMGKCKRNAPTVNVTDVYNQPVFPHVSFSDHCGDWDLTNDLYRAKTYFDELNREKEID